MDCHGLQCGFCTPGLVVSVTALLDANPSPTRDEVAVALSGNLCRCTGYQGIFAAVERAADLLRGEGRGERRAEPAGAREGVA
jgi:carbon-monoxide dehydrogenase small subunit